MSQQTNAGFNAPEFSVVADEPAGSIPMATLDRYRPCRPSSCEGGILVVRFSLADARGVGYSATAACVTAARSGPWFRAASLIAPSVDRTPLSAREAVGVGHRPAMRGSSSGADTFTTTVVSDSCDPFVSPRRRW
ncbi:hypothetical protein A7X92_00475 [Stenotrophomonas maltophilia]|nr:hypothetical protein A7X92_00475 [Stenotrophomonas maltophilia]